MMEYVPPFNVKILSTVWSVHKLTKRSAHFVIKGITCIWEIVILGLVCCVWLEILGRVMVNVSHVLSLVIQISTFRLIVYLRCLRIVPCIIIILRLLWIRLYVLALNT
jgi:hypothetical protein